MNNRCRICGYPGEGQPFITWVKGTFTNYDDLHPGEIICKDCLFWFEQRSVDLQEKMGKDKPQKMQNYSHFVINGEWLPLSKGDKLRMADILLTGEFPELAAVAVSGQKHIAFRARRNPTGQNSGWVQFEEDAIFVRQDELRALLAVIEQLYIVFSKTEIETGHYYPNRIMKFGVEQWNNLEQKVVGARGTQMFDLALFLAQRKDRHDDAGSGEQIETDGSDSVDDDLAGDSIRLQEKIPDDDLGSVRKRDQGSSLHERPGEVRQSTLWPIERNYRD